MRAGIFGVGILATIMGITITTIYGLWYLCADLVYVILFPQLVSVVYLDDTNTYGSLAGYLIGMMFRLMGGEPLIGLPPAMHYPWYDEVNNLQKFPFKTICMMISFSMILAFSYLTKFIFETGKLPKHWDIFMCVVNIPDEAVQLKTPNGKDDGEMTILNARKPSESNGQINPNLKFTKDELLVPSQGVINKALELSPASETPPPKAPEYNENTTGL